MWNRYHPWNCAQNNQLTNSTEEEVTWPLTLRLRKRLVASGLGTDDGVEQRTDEGGFCGQISSTRFIGFSPKKKRGNLWCQFWHPFDFWLECWLFDTLIPDLSTALLVFVTAGNCGGREEACWTFLAPLYNDLWPCNSNVISECRHTQGTRFLCLSVWTQVSVSWCLLSPPTGTEPGWAG